MLNKIGIKDPAVTYIDRPTVKVLIQKGALILILNDGLLPGGGINDRESDTEAVKREIAEEIGATVTNIQPIGQVIQYREFLKKRYVIKGYTAQIMQCTSNTDPQDEGEKKFTYRWLLRQDALHLVEQSIEAFADIDIQNDTQQGKFFNLKTTFILLSELK
jgi:8-oxo-dGTP pyrophosphatase MutT (NUDIX family)